MDLDKRQRCFAGSTCVSSRCGMDSIKICYLTKRTRGVVIRLLFFCCKYYRLSYIYLLIFSWIYGLYALSSFIFCLDKYRYICLLVMGQMAGCCAKMAYFRKNPFVTVRCMMMVGWLDWDAAISS
jgi:hypothetical protein